MSPKPATPHPRLSITAALSALLWTSCGPPPVTPLAQPNCTLPPHHPTPSPSPSHECVRLEARPPPVCLLSTQVLAYLPFYFLPTAAPPPRPTKPLVPPFLTRFYYSVVLTPPQGVRSYLTHRFRLATGLILSCRPLRLPQLACFIAVSPRAATLPTCLT